MIDDGESEGGNGVGEDWNGDGDDSPGEKTG